MKNLLILFVFIFAFISCEEQGKQQHNEQKEAPIVNIVISGSVSLYPAIELKIGQFRKSHKNARIAVRVSGTKAGYRDFQNQEVDIFMSSYVLDETQKSTLEKTGISFQEIAFGTDTVFVIVNKDNPIAGQLSVDDIRKLFSRDQNINTWSDLHKNFPNENIHTYTPDTTARTYQLVMDYLLGTYKKAKQSTETKNDYNYIVNKVHLDKNAVGVVSSNFLNPQKNIIHLEKPVIARELVIYCNKNRMKKNKVLSEFVHSLSEVN